MEKSQILISTLGAVRRFINNGALWRGVAIGFAAALVIFAIVFTAFKASAGANPQPSSQAPVAAAAIALAGTLIIGLLSAVVTYLGHLITRQNAVLAAETNKLQAGLSDKNAVAANILNRENALLSARLAVSSKLADLRQAWINNLRNDMAEYQALGVTGEANSTRQTEFFARMVRIELCINPKDPCYKEFHETLYSYIDGKRSKDWDHWDDRFTRICQNILKAEWDILKNDLTSIVAQQSAAVTVMRSISGRPAD